MKHVNNQKSHKAYNPDVYQKNIAYEDECSNGDMPYEASGENVNFIARPKVLIVEDNFARQTTYMEMLSQIDCKVDLAENGHEAVVMAHKKAYDVIFIDSRLARINGLAVTKLIREQEPKYHRSAIIALARYDDAIEHECKEAGWDDFYTQPVLLKDLIGILKHWLPHLIAPHHHFFN